MTKLKMTEIIDSLMDLNKLNNDKLLTNNLNKNIFTTESLIFETQDNKQKKIDIINDFKFNYMNKCLTLTSSNSNADIIALYYKKEEYETSTILKCSKNNNSDSLFYEFLAGLFINKLTKRFPCFIETYGLYYYNNCKNFSHDVDYTKCIESGFLNQFTKIIDIDKSIFEKAFNDPKLFTIIIQNVENSKMLSRLLVNKDFIINDLLYVLFQIYAPLCVCALKFTHYDLHDKNILLYKLKENSYIEYHYETKNKEIITFKCEYIAKIIDYGHVYFNDDTENEITSSSKNIYKQLLEIPSFLERKDYKGFQWFDEKQKRTNYFISSINSNISHDLRLLNQIKLNYIDKIQQYNQDIYEILNNVNYGKGITTVGKNCIKVYNYYFLDSLVL